MRLRPLPPPDGFLTAFSSPCDLNHRVWTSSSEPAAPREEDEVATESPVQEPPEAEKESDALELKAESAAAAAELQADAHTHEEQTEKSSTPAPPTAEPASDPAPAPEENRVGPELRPSFRLSAGSRDLGRRL